MKAEPRCGENAECSQNGHCNIETGRCECNAGWAGYDCANRVCPSDCSHHGYCLNGAICACDAGWYSKDCSTRVCPNDCSGRGICHNGTCCCASGWLGRDCSASQCQNNCNGHGTCNLEGVCSCSEGWQGVACATFSFTNYCSCAPDCTEKCITKCSSLFDAAGATPANAPTQLAGDAADTPIVGGAKEVASSCYLGCASECMQSCLEQQKANELSTMFIGPLKCPKPPPKVASYNINFMGATH